MHKLLERQLKKSARLTPDGSVDYAALLEVISATYEDFEKERRLKDRSFTLMSEELLQLNEQLRQESAERERRVQEQLERSQSFIEKVAHTLPTMLYVYDLEERRTIFSNRKILEALGLGDDVRYGDISDTFLQEFMHPEDFAALGERFYAIANSSDGEVITSEFRLRNSRQEWLWFEVNETVFERLTGGKVKQILGAAQNITERKIVQQRLVESKEMAEMANKAKSEFLANMSHEIRTPMNAILGFVELLQDHVIEPKYASYLKGVSIAGKNLLQLINDILDLSKIEAGQMDVQFEPVNLYTLCDELRQIFAVKMQERNLPLDIVINPDVPSSLVLDETRLRQILFNLTGNAFKFTEKGSVSILVDMGVYGDDNSKIALYIEVRDTGIGIPQDQQERIFEAFRQQEGQSTRRFGGTGLGLTITKRLVEMLKGTITVESTVGKGSSFKVFLPDVVIGSGSLSPSPSPAWNDEEGDFHGATILVVDDIESNRMVVAGYLERYHVAIIEAAHGGDAIEKARQYLPNLILMDMQMPIMDGYEAVNIIKNDPLLRSTPVIALTASAMERDVQAISTLCEGYLRKPVTRFQLLSELQRFLPYTSRHSQEHGATIQRLYATTEPIICSAELMAQMQSLSMLWQRIKPAKDNLAIEEFALLTLRIGSEHGLEALKQYGEDLHHQSTNFKIIEMQRTFDIFPTLASRARLDTTEQAHVGAS